MIAVDLWRNFKIAELTQFTRQKEEIKFIDDEWTGITNQEAEMINLT